MAIIRVNDITAVYWSSEVDNFGEVVEGIEDIHQSIGLILQTRKRKCPHRPNFGSNIHDYIGLPIDEAIPHVIRESINALADNEPRIDIINVDVDIDGHIIILKTTWTLKESEIENITEVIVNG